MRILSILVLCTLFGFLACQRSEEVDVTTEDKLAGRWDSYFAKWDNGHIAADGPVYAVLFNYEHGFELREDGVYFSRFNDSNGIPWTSTNAGTWKVEGNNLIFGYTDMDGKHTTMAFAISRLEDRELQIISEFGLTISLRKPI